MKPIKILNLQQQIKRFQTQEILTQYYNKKSFANKNGTFKFSKRNPLINEHHFKTPYHDTLFLSSIGIGTHTGSSDLEDDLKYFNAILDSILSYKINMIDTAIDYRFQRSDRTIGAAISYLVQNELIERNELFIASKIGYLPQDIDNEMSSDQLISNLIKSNQIQSKDIIEDTHCLHPNFLLHQLNQTLQNLQLQTLDLLYLQNPAESQLSTLGHNKFYHRLAKAFEFCEEQIQQNKIKSYGLATWSCFRSQSKDQYLSLQKCQEIAQKIAGDKNGFKYVQAPCNIMMSEIFTEKWQILKQDDEEKKVSLFKAARLLKLNIITSQPLMKGALQQVNLPEDVFKLQDNCARHIQFIRSIPAESLLCTLVGMKQKKHVSENLKVCYLQQIYPEEFWDFLRPTEIVQNK